MANPQMLDALRENLIAEITDGMCLPCKAQNQPIQIDDPARCPCHCERVEPLLDRLSEIERAIAISEAYLNKSLHAQPRNRKLA